MHATAEATRPQPIRFRGRSYVAFVFTPVVPIVSWLEEIDATLARSPGFFVGRPVVLDLAGLDLSASAITHLVNSIEQDFPQLPSGCQIILEGKSKDLILDNIRTQLKATITTLARASGISTFQARLIS